MQTEKTDEEATKIVTHFMDRLDRLHEIAEYFKRLDVDMYYVGGAVRDQEMFDIHIGYTKDIDICLVGTDRETTQRRFEILLSTEMIDGFTTVHGNFPIWIVEFLGDKYEFALARTEKKTGDTHQDFKCEVENVTIEEDLKRRDLTINAIAQNVLTGEIVDPFDGRIDIEEKIASTVSESFREDPLRVVRAARFIALYDLRPSLELKSICKLLSPKEISFERFGLELMKLFSGGGKPSKFFEFLREVGWLEYCFPELHALIEVPQSKLHHPEGDSYIHSMHCLDACKDGDWFTKAVMLCHDLGKATTTTIDGINYTEGLLTRHNINIAKGAKIQALGHEEAGVQLTKDMLKRIHFCSYKDINRISVLVRYHMIRAFITTVRSREKMVRRTLRELMYNDLQYDQLVEVVRCDLAGRPPLEPIIPYIGQDYAKLILEEGEMEPIVTGELLVKLGMKPSPAIGAYVKKALELQDRGSLKKHNWQHVMHGAGYKIK